MRFYARVFDEQGRHYEADDRRGDARVNWDCRGLWS